MDDSMKERMLKKMREKFGAGASPSEASASDPDAIEIHLVHHGEGGNEEPVKIPKDLEESTRAGLQARRDAREKLFDGLEKEFGADARKAAEMACAWFAHSQMVFRAMHKSNTPQQIEDMLREQDVQVQSRLTRVLFDLCFPVNERCENLRGNPELFPATRLLTTCLAIAKDDVQAMDDASTGLAEYVKTLNDSERNDRTLN